jgi:hypothetical protein
MLFQVYMQPITQRLLMLTTDPLLSSFFIDMCIHGAWVKNTSLAMLPLPLEYLK